MNWRPWDTRTYASTPEASKTGSSLGSRPKADITNEGGSELTAQNRRPTLPEDHRDLLESTALAHVATIGPYGEPQTNPVWFAWDGELVRFSQIKTRQKYRNVRRAPRITLSIADPEDRFLYLKIWGVVERIEEDPDPAFMNSMAKKGPSTWTNTRTTGPGTSGWSSW